MPLPTSTSPTGAHSNDSTAGLELTPDQFSHNDIASLTFVHVRLDVRLNSVDKGRLLTRRSPICYVPGLGVDVLTL